MAAGATEVQVVELIFEFLLNPSFGSWLCKALLWSRWAVYFNDEIGSQASSLI